MNTRSQCGNYRSTDESRKQRRKANEDRLASPERPSIPTPPPPSSSCKTRKRGRPSRAESEATDEPRPKRQAPGRRDPEPGQTSIISLLELNGHLSESEHLLAPRSDKELVARFRTSVNHHLREGKTRLHRLETKSENQKAALVAIRERVAKTDGAVQVLQSEYKRLEESVGKLCSDQHSWEVLQEVRLDELSARQNSWEDNQNSWKANQNSWKDHENSWEEKQNQLEMDQDTLKRDLGDVQDGYEKLCREQDVLETRQDELEAAQKGFSDSQEASKRAAESCAIEHATLDKDMKALEHKLESQATILATLKQNLQSEKDARTKDIKALAAYNRSISTDVAAMDSEFETTKDHLSEMAQQLGDTRAELDGLKSSVVTKEEVKSNTSTGRDCIVDAKLVSQASRLDDLKRDLQEQATTEEVKRQKEETKEVMVPKELLSRSWNDVYTHAGQEVQNSAAGIECGQFMDWKRIMAIEVTKAVNAALEEKEEKKSKDLEATLKRLTDKIEELQSANAKAPRKEELESSMASENKALREEMAATRVEMEMKMKSMVGTVLDAAQHREKELRKESAEMDQKQKELEVTVASLTAQIKNVQSGNAKVETRLHKQEQSLGDLSSTLASTNGDVNDVNARIDATNTRITSTVDDSEARNQEYQAKLAALKTSVTLCESAYNESKDQATKDQQNIDHRFGCMDQRSEAVEQRLTAAEAAPRTRTRVEQEELPVTPNVTRSDLDELWDRLDAERSIRAPLEKDLGNLRRNTKPLIDLKPQIETHLSTTTPKMQSDIQSCREDLDGFKAWTAENFENMAKRINGCFQGRDQKIQQLFVHVSSLGHAQQQSLPPQRQMHPALNHQGSRTQGQPLVNLNLPRSMSFAQRQQRQQLHQHQRPQQGNPGPPQQSQPSQRQQQPHPRGPETSPQNGNRIFPNR